MNSCWRLLVAATKMWNWTMNRVEEGGKDLWSEHLVGTNEKSPICKCIAIIYCIFHLLNCISVSSLANWSPKIGDEETTLDQLQKAFKVWSDYAHLKFVRVPTPDADIVILFGRGYHGDRYAVCHCHPKGV